MKIIVPVMKKVIMVTEHTDIPGKQSCVINAAEVLCIQECFRDKSQGHHGKSLNLLCNCQSPASTVTQHAVV